MLVTQTLQVRRLYHNGAHEMMSLELITGSVVYRLYHRIRYRLVPGVEYKQYAFVNRMTGQYWWAYW